MVIIGIETKCGMIGLGVIQVGIHGVHLIGGHHLDTIGGDIIYTMVGITTDGDTVITDGTIITDGILGIITIIIIEEVT